MKLGVIADDFTGATDIAGFLVDNGIITIQVNGAPQVFEALDAEAFVVSLKSRSCPVDAAVSQSLAALQWLKDQGCTQIYFKYCSTFDSSEQGNIGPVTDALMDALNEDLTLVCPALPVNKRTVYGGHLFVGDQLLNESGMKDHPVTPMKQSCLVTLMEQQSRGKAGKLVYQDVEMGVGAVEKRIEKLKASGCRYIIADALNNTHLDTLAVAFLNWNLVTGGSGLAIGIANNWDRVNRNIEEAQSAGKPSRAKSVIITGSCSLMTNKQVAVYKEKGSSLFVDTGSCLERKDEYVQELTQWVLDHADESLAPMLYATKTTEELAVSKSKYGDINAGEAIESVLGRVAIRLKESGVKNFITAGGETSGMIVQSLQAETFNIGPQIAPGVPWIKSRNENVFFALKSGNFGDEHFFEKAQKFYE